MASPFRHRNGRLVVSRLSRAVFPNRNGDPVDGKLKGKRKFGNYAFGAEISIIGVFENPKICFVDSVSITARAVIELPDGDPAFASFNHSFTKEGHVLDVTLLNRASEFDRSKKSQAMFEIVDPNMLVEMMELTGKGKVPNSISELAKIFNVKAVNLHVDVLARMYMAISVSSTTEVAYGETFINQFPYDNDELTIATGVDHIGIEPPFGQTIDK